MFAMPLAMRLASVQLGLLTPVLRQGRRHFGGSACFARGLVEGNCGCFRSLIGTRA